MIEDFLMVEATEDGGGWTDGVAGAWIYSVLVNDV